MAMTDRASPDPRETARYVEQVAREMRKMTAAADIGFLAFLLGMVEDEAAATVRRLGEEGSAG